ncbi:iron-sulfur assembly protein 1 [Monosporozyma servazzii]
MLRVTHESNRLILSSLRPFSRYIMTSNTASPFKFKFIPQINSNNEHRPQKKLTSHTLPSKEILQKHNDIIERKNLIDQQQLSNAKDIVQQARDNEVTNSSTSSSLLKKKRKRTLRARKAVITLSPTAITHLKSLLELPEPKMIRVSTKNRGCSGTQYDLSYVTKPEKFDEIVEQDGIKIIIDSKALFSVVGSEMDWIDDKLNTKFIFKNPNSKGTCGCGESFMT